MPNSVVNEIQCHRTFWRFQVATITASFIACLLSSILHVNCVYTVIIDATFNLWSICKLEEAPGTEGFVMVLIMTNYFLCKLCIHTRTHDTNWWCQTWAFMIMHWGLRGHTFSHKYNQCCIATGTAWHQSVFCSHQWGFSCKFTIKTFCWCTSAAFAFPSIRTDSLMLQSDKYRHTFYIWCHFSNILLFKHKTDITPDECSGFSKVEMLLLLCTAPTWRVKNLFFWGVSKSCFCFLTVTEGI